MNPDETARLMSEAGVAPKRSMGQNFLADGRVAARQVAYAGVEPGDRVLEVGPGLGMLTGHLVRAGAEVTCIELDPALAGYIEREFGGSVELIRGDAVKVPFPPFDRFVSNLPYSASTPIIFKLLGCRFEKAVVMVQREFADRMVADVGGTEYSRLTVDLFYRAECRILEGVPASRFRPKPKVDSALVEIVPRPAPFEVLDEGMFFKVVEAGFNHRRKKLGTSLRAAGLVRKGEEVPFADARIETLTPAEIGEASDAVAQLAEGRRLANI